MPTDPAFSIIVPTRNRPRELKEALFSIAEQRATDVEILVVDDGSTSDFLDDIHDLSAQLDSRFRFIWRPIEAPRHGPAIARNTGIAVARGEYVGFLDDDDHWCDPEHLAVALKALKSTPETDLYVANQVATRGADVEVDPWLPYVDRVASRCPMAGDGVHAIKRHALLIPEGIGFPHLNMCLVRRDLIERIGGFWPGTPYEEDLNFFLRVVDQSREILYRKSTVSVHKIRDEALTGASSWDEFSKLLFRMLALQHALLKCQSREVRSYAKLLLAGALKTLSKRSHEARHWSAAADYAGQAASLTPSLRWRLIATYLRARSLISEPIKPVRADGRRSPREMVE